MSRAKWKGPKQISSFLKIKTLTNSKFFFRSGIILPIFLNKIFRVYNGRSFYSVKVTNFLFGFRFGEFIFTRKKLSK